MGGKRVAEIARESSNVQLQSQLLGNLRSTFDIYATMGLRTIAVVKVVMRIDYVHGFIYKENDKIFFCINSTLDVVRYNYAKIWLLALYLLSKDKMKDGVYPDILMEPQCKYVDTEIRDDMINVLIANLIEKCECDIDEDTNIITYYSEALNLPEWAVLPALQHAHIEGLQQPAILRYMAKKSSSLNQLPRIPFDQQGMSYIRMLLDDTVHSTFTEAFGSSKIVMDCDKRIQDEEENDMIGEAVPATISRRYDETKSLVIHLKSESEALSCITNGLMSREVAMANLMARVRAFEKEANQDRPDKEKLETAFSNLAGAQEDYRNSGAYSDEEQDKLASMQKLCACDGIRQLLMKINEFLSDFEKRSEKEGEPDEGSDWGHTPECNGECE